MKRITFLLFTFPSLLPSSAQELRSDIGLSDPFVMADAKTQQYYMTGTGGGLWKSSDLEVWTYLGFPLQFNEAAWMGASPQVWASEIHWPSVADSVTLMMSKSYQSAYKSSSILTY